MLVLIGGHYVLICSHSLTIRRFSRPYNAFRVIIFLLIIWTIFFHSSSCLFQEQVRSMSSASRYLCFFYAIYSLIVIDIFPLLLMIIFSLLARYNLKLIRRGIAPEQGTARTIIIHKHDRYLMRTLSGRLNVLLRAIL